MGTRDAARHLGHQEQSAPELEGPFASDVGEGAPSEKLHDEIGRPILGLALVEDLDDVRVGELLSALGFATEALLDDRLASEGRGHDLHRARALGQRLGDPIDRGHSPFADHFFDEVSARDGRPDTWIANRDEVYPIDEAVDGLAGIAEVTSWAGLHRSGRDSGVNPGKAGKYGNPSSRYSVAKMNLGLPARLGVFAGLLAGFLGLSLASGVWARERYAPASYLPGLKVDGASAPKGGDLRSFVEGRAAALLARSIRLTVDGDDVTPLARGVPTEQGASAIGVSLSDLGVTVDVDAVVARVTSLETEGDLLVRYQRAERARRSELDVPLDLKIDSGKALPLVCRVKEGTDVAPISARLDLDHRAAIPGRPGRYVDADAALEAILAVARHPEIDAVALPTRNFPPHISRAFVETLDVQATLGEYETYFSRAGDQARRGKNIDVAAKKIDGLVLSPGELVSFNDVVGERSEDNGFAKSWEIYKGEMVEGIGGGTCQVASTFYATLFFGGMDVIERLPHSRPSAYIPMGLDATVVFPIVDLKVRNPYDFPVVIRAKTLGNKLRMQLLGADKPATVTFQRELVDTFPYKRKVVVDPRLRGSTKVVMKQHGIQGYKIKRTRVVVFKDGTRQKETNTDVYPSTTEIYEVPPGFDETLLPPLPDADKDDEEGEGPSEGSQAPKAAGTEAPAMPLPVEDSARPPAACRGNCLDIVEGSGAHPPTDAQSNPPKMLVLLR
jgi:vancomycin resistance protein YoaR